MVNLDLDSLFHGFPLLLRPRDRLGAHDASAPVPFRFLVLLRVAFLDGGDELRELGLVFGADLGECENGCRLYSFREGRNLLSAKNFLSLFLKRYQYTQREISYLFVHHGA